MRLIYISSCLPCHLMVIMQQQAMAGAHLDCKERGTGRNLGKQRRFYFHNS
ncbi:hypothetical protein DAI22_12g113800 [Oryza sativa Japonica Group]|nr:hypothetical protein DAI22_12g113800 [Oryza sativa Japonica Group]